MPTILGEVYKYEVLCYIISSILYFISQVPGTYLGRFFCTAGWFMFVRETITFKTDENEWEKLIHPHKELHIFLLRF
jgi:hypothetical protein